jgi:hypothetical protein
MICQKFVRRDGNRATERSRFAKRLPQPRLPGGKPGPVFSRAARPSRIRWLVNAILRRARSPPAPSTLAAAASPLRPRLSRANLARSSPQPRDAFRRTLAPRLRNARPSARWGRDRARARVSGASCAGFGPCWRGHAWRARRRGVADWRPRRASGRRTWTSRVDADPREVVRRRGLLRSPELVGDARPNGFASC